MVRNKSPVKVLSVLMCFMVLVSMFSTMVYADAETSPVSNHRQRIIVKKEWETGTTNQQEVTVEIRKKSDNTCVKELKLNSSNNWTAEYEPADSTLAYEVVETKIGGNESAVQNYIVTYNFDKKESEEEKSAEINDASQIVVGGYYIILTRQGSKEYYFCTAQSGQKYILGTTSYSENPVMTDDYYWKLVRDDNGDYHLQSKTQPSLYMSSAGTTKGMVRELSNNISDKNTKISLGASGNEGLSIWVEDDKGKTHDFRHFFGNKDNETNNNEGSGSYTIARGYETEYVDTYTFTITNKSKQYAHTLNYNANGGSGAPNSQSYTGTESPHSFTISSTEPTRTGYTFKGWADNVYATEASYQSGGTIPVSGTKTIYAVWEINTYTVKWVDYDDTELEKDENVPYGTYPSYDGSTPTRLSTAEYDYTFSGWSPEIQTVTGNATYKAQYTSTKRSYTITWVDGNGNTLKTETLEYGETPIYNGDEPTKTETDEYTYEFANAWSTTQDGKPVTIPTVTGDATYYAVFNAKSLDVPLTGIPTEKTTAYVVTGISILAAGMYFAAMRSKRRKTV